MTWYKTNTDITVNIDEAQPQECRETTEVVVGGGRGIGNARIVLQLKVISIF